MRRRRPPASVAAGSERLTAIANSQNVANARGRGMRRTGEHRVDRVCRCGDVGARRPGDGFAQSNRLLTHVEGFAPSERLVPRVEGRFGFRSEL